MIESEIKEQWGLVGVKELMVCQSLAVLFPMYVNSRGIHFFSLI